MRQTRTRILSLLLALVMCLSLLPVTAMAAGGSSGEPALFLDPDQQGLWLLGEEQEVSVAPLYIMPPSSTGNSSGKLCEIKVPANGGSPVYEVQQVPSSPSGGESANGHPAADQPPQNAECYLLVEIIDLDNEIHAVLEGQYPSGTTVTFRGSGSDKIIYQISGTGSAASNPNSFVLTDASTLLLEASCGNVSITYNYNGAGETDTKQVRYQSAISLPTPSLPGYLFLGWYYGTPRGQYLTEYGLFSNGTATGNITLYDADKV